MGRCQEKFIHMKILKKQYDMLKEELNNVQSKKEFLEKDHIALVKEVYDKPLDDHEMALQEFILNGFNRTKLDCMIYGVSISKSECLGYSQKSFNHRFETLSKPKDHSSLNSTKKGLNSYFVPAAENAKVLN